MKRLQHKQLPILLAAMLITLVLGSVHSFSVFLVPLEQLLNRSRADVSLIYSFALIALTFSVLVGYRIYSLLPPAKMLVSTCCVASLGLIGSAYSESWWLLFISYSLLFGFSNGVGYGYCLQLIGRALPDDKGFGMAAVTAAYAVGSVLFSLILAKVIQYVSASTAFLVLAMAIFTAGLIAASVMKTMNVHYGETKETTIQADSTGPIFWLWIAYGASVFAGLMAIGHAAGIIQAMGGQYEEAIWGAVFIGFGSAIGGFLIGWIINQRNMHQLLIGLPMLSALCLFILANIAQYHLAIVFLSCIGFAYGALIAVYPYVISEVYGDQAGPKVYGRVFTAWGFAGLVGPWTAGRLYDYQGQYNLALFIAGVIAVIASVTYWYIQKQIDLKA